MVYAPCRIVNGLTVVPQVVFDSREEAWEYVRDHGEYSYTILIYVVESKYIKGE